MKIVRKLNGAVPYDIEGIQRWLEDMSAQGLHLQHWGNNWSTFQQGEPKSIRYRLDPDHTKSTSDEGIEAENRVLEEAYGEMGWRKVSPVSSFQFGSSNLTIFAADDPGVPELYTDPDSYALSMHDLFKQVLSDALWRLLYVVVFFSLEISNQLFYYEAAVSLGESVSLFPFVAYVGCLLLHLFYLVCSAMLLRSYRALKRGDALPSSGRWSRRLAHVRLLSDLLFLLLCVGLVIYIAKNPPITIA